MYLHLSSKKVSSGVQSILSKLNTHKQTHVEVSTGNIKLHTVHLPHNKTFRVLPAYRNSKYSSSPPNTCGCLSVFLSLSDSPSDISGVPMVTAAGAEGSTGSKV